MEDMERTAALNELAKIKDEIDTLLIQKSLIVDEINIPIYKAKAEAEKIIKDAEAEAKVIVNASKRLQGEAEHKLIQANDLLHTAKGGIEELKAGEAKLAQDRVDFDAYRFSQDNMFRQQKIAVDDQSRENRQLAESVEVKLIEIKQREETVSRREADVKTREDEADKIKTEHDVEKIEQDNRSQEITRQLEIARSIEANNVVKEQELFVLKATIEVEKTTNQKILDETITRKHDLTRQQNDLARQIELLDASKVEMDEKSKSLKEQQRLVEMKIRQDEEKIARLQELRKEEK